MGMRVLLRRIGLAAGDLAALHLAGGFATHLDVPNAERNRVPAPVPPTASSEHGNAVGPRGRRAPALAGGPGPP